MRRKLWALMAALASLAPSWVSAAAQGVENTFNNAQQSGLSNASIMAIAESTMSWLFGILGFIAIIGFVIAGLLYLTAAGDEDQIDQAKEATWYSLIGVIVALVGLVVLYAVDGFLSANDSF